MRRCATLVYNPGTPEDTGTILVCDRTEALCRSVFRFRELGPLQIEGHAEARHVFALEGARAESPL